jgi:hypothetical protein
MDLVRDDHDAVVEADAPEALELKPGPDAADGVVGAAEDEELVARIAGLGLEVGVVHLVAAAMAHEGIVHDSAAMARYHVREGIVDGALDDDAVTGLGEELDEEGQGRDHAGAVEDIGPIDVPAEAASKPPADGIIIRGAFLARIAENVALNPLFQSGDDCRGAGEIHIGYPERQGSRAGRGLEVLHELPFEAIGPAAVDKGVKIVFHESLLGVGGFEARPLFMDCRNRRRV